METLIYKNYRIPYQIIHKKVKNITLRFDEQGHFIVVCNAFVPKDKIEEVLGEKIEWILINQAKAQKRANQMDRTAHQIFILGEAIQVHKIAHHYNDVKLEGTELYVYYVDELFIEKLMEKFLNAYVKKVVEPYIIHYSRVFHEDYGIQPPQIKFRDLKGKWGSCQPTKGIITLSQKLVHTPKRFIEYVVLHEFAHFIQPNHSKSFYYVVEKYMSDYKTVSKSCVLE